MLTASLSLKLKDRAMESRAPLFGAAALFLIGAVGLLVTFPVPEAGRAFVGTLRGASTPPEAPVSRVGDALVPQLPVPISSAGSLAAGSVAAVEDGTDGAASVFAASADIGRGPTAIAITPALAAGRTLVTRVRSESARPRSPVSRVSDAPGPALSPPADSVADDAPAPALAFEPAAPAVTQSAPPPASETHSGVVAASGSPPPAPSSVVKRGSDHGAPSPEHANRKGEHPSATGSISPIGVVTTTSGHRSSSGDSKAGHEDGHAPKVEDAHNERASKPAETRSEDREDHEEDKDHD